MRIIAFGDTLFTTAFRLGGLQDVVVASPVREEVEAALDKIFEEEKAMVIMQDKLFNVLSSRDRKRIESSTDVLFTIISLEGEESSIESIRDMVKRTLGIEMK